MSDGYSQFWQQMDELKARHESIISDLKRAAEPLSVGVQVSSDGEGYHVRFTKHGLRKHFVDLDHKRVLKQLAEFIESIKPKVAK